METLRYVVYIHHYQQVIILLYVSLYYLFSDNKNVWYYKGKYKRYNTMRDEYYKFKEGCEHQKHTPPFG